MRRLLLCLPLLLAAAPGLHAQATRDQARLIINLFAGYAMGGSLWRVPDQPVIDDNFGEPRVDHYALSRRIRGNPIFGGRAIFFPSDHFGYFGEAFMLGLGYEDGCGIANPTASQRNRDVCASINNNSTPATAVQVTAGVMYRIRADQLISPYARLSVGGAMSSRSPIAMTGSFPSAASGGQLVDLDIYPAEGSTQFHPAIGIGAGFTTQLARGYQMRWELRDNIVGVDAVTGATVLEGVEPPTGMRFRHRISIEVGFDVVLERKRGRRY
ncbi:MAG TPA: hypothetical protein VFS94_01530 [Gemmatimonadales bacterium]|nr:hypothetical protein [Gemmatimonadales bacterium]